MADREYQTWAVEEIWRYFESNTGNPVIAMPTGTGKSHVISSLIRSMFMAFPRTRVMMLTHVKELIGQNYEKFIHAWPTAPIGLYSAGLRKADHTQAITFAGIGSVANKAHLFGHIDIVFIDECDLVSHKEDTMYRKFLKALMAVNPALKVIGLTATPWRKGLGLITEEEGGIFTDIPVNMCSMDAFNWFVDQGYLAPLISAPTKFELDVTGVHVRGGEYVEGELQAAIDKDYITERALRECLDKASDRSHWLVFGSGRQHCSNIAEMLGTMGIEARAVYSGMPDKDRDKYIDAYKKGHLQALVNQNILTTGFDAPHTDLIVGLRPTLSSRFWVQLLGRGTRPVFEDGFDLTTVEGRLAAIRASGKQNCLVMDFARNIDKLGPINDPVIPRPKGKGGPQPAPVKVCPNCDKYNHASYRWCGGKDPKSEQYDPLRGCGHEFIFEMKLNVQASQKEVIRKDEAPIIETLAVDSITYNLHEKVGSFPSMRVTYFCGMRHFSTWVCVEHPKGGPAYNKARGWWATRQVNGYPPFPADINAALDTAQALKVPTHIDVHTNTKLPEIKRHCFDGTGFSGIKIEDPTQIQRPRVIVQEKRKNGHKPASEIDFYDRGETVKFGEEPPF